MVKLVQNVQDVEHWFLMMLRYEGSPQETSGCTEDVSEPFLMTFASGRFTQKRLKTPKAGIFK